MLREICPFSILKKTSRFLFIFTIVLGTGLSFNMMQKDIIVETARDKMPTINHFSCYSINSLRYVRMRGETKQEREVGMGAEKPRCFSFIFYPNNKSRQTP